MKHSQTKPNLKNRIDLDEIMKDSKEKSRFKTTVSILMQLFILIKINKKWWLLPLLLILAFLSIFVSLTGNQSILPAIYALF